eukprot:7665785-Karenia_brevis.AAC.1
MCHHDVCPTRRLQQPLVHDDVCTPARSSCTYAPVLRKGMTSSLRVYVGPDVAEAIVACHYVCPTAVECMVHARRERI